MRKLTDPIVIRGITYPSPEAAAETFGVARKTILRAARMGRLDVVGIPAHKTRHRSGPSPYRVRIRGKYYEDARAAAKALGVSPTTVRCAVGAGREDFIGLGVSRKHNRAAVGLVAHNSKPVTIGPHSWPSVRQAAKALGIGADTLRDLIQGGKTAKLMAHAMKYEAAQIKARMKEAA